MDYTFEDTGEFRRELERETFGESEPGIWHYDGGAAKARQLRAVDRIIAEHHQEEQDAANFRAWERENEKFFAEQDRSEVPNQRPTVFDGKYRLTGNAFNGTFHTWRMFPAKRGTKLEDLRKTDEKRAVYMVARVEAKLGSIKIAFPVNPF